MKIYRDQDAIAAAELAALNQQRSTWSAFRRAFRMALRLLLVAPGTSIHDVVEAYVAANPTSAVALAWPDIVEFQRMHADVAEFAALFSMADAQVDVVFQVAMAIEAGDEATATALVAAWNEGIE